MTGRHPGEQPGHEQGAAPQQGQPPAPPTPPAPPAPPQGDGQAAAQPGVPGPHGAPPPAAPYGAQQPAAGYPAAPPVPVPTRSDRARRQALMGWIAAAVAFVVLGAGAVFLFTDDDSDSKGKAAGVAKVDGADGDEPGAAPARPGTPGTDTGGGSGENSGEDTGTTTGGSSGRLVKPGHTTGPDGTTIVVGEKDSKHTLDVYEDMRCPFCAMFEQKVGSTVAKDIEAGKYKAQFHMAAFLDGKLTGSGSKNALSALGAALDVSPDAFLAYKKALYSEEHHPEESVDSFADDDYLLKVAREVPALKSDAGFAKAVREGTYDAWAEKVAAAFMEAGVGSVPSVRLDGQPLAEGGGTPMSPAEYNAAVAKRL